MSKPVPLCAMLVAFALLAACGPTTPSPASLDGQWSGTTSQGAPFAFTVSTDQKVTAIIVGYNFNGCSGQQTYSGLNLDTTPNVTCIPAPCSSTIASYRAFGYSDRSIEGPSTTVNGLFTSPKKAEGQVAFRDYPGCGSAPGIAWTATRP